MVSSESDFLQMIDEYQNVIHGVCRMYTNDQEDHNDLFQEILSQLWVGYERFQNQSKVSTWIYRVSLYTSITHIKKVMRSRGTIENLKLESEQHETHKLESEEMLLSAVKKLNEMDRAFVLLYLEDKSYQEMAEILGLSLSNVGVKLNRIKKKLKKLIEPEYGT